MDGRKQRRTSEVLKMPTEKILTKKMQYTGYIPSMYALLTLQPETFFPEECAKGKWVFEITVEARPAEMENKKVN